VVTFFGDICKVVWGEGLRVLPICVKTFGWIVWKDVFRCV
jgi:hypothetical protein